MFWKSWQHQHLQMYLVSKRVSINVWQGNQGSSCIYSLAVMVVQGNEMLLLLNLLPCEWSHLCETRGLSEADSTVIPVHQTHIGTQCRGGVNWCDRNLDNRVSQKIPKWLGIPKWLVLMHTWD